MVDSYTTNLLTLWAIWHIRKVDDGQGYPKKCAFVIEASGGGFWTPEIDSQCYVIDAYVCDLLPERKEVLIAYYTAPGTNEAKAKQCGISPRTYWTRLDLAQRDISFRLRG